MVEEALAATATGMIAVFMMMARTMAAARTGGTFISGKPASFWMAMTAILMIVGWVMSVF